jgi:hypothetical protein
VVDKQSFDSNTEAADLDGEAFYSRAKSSVIIGVLAFFPGIGLAFIWVVFGLLALIAALIGLYRGLTCLRVSSRPSPTWMAAIIGTCISGAVVFMLIGLFVWSLFLVK